MSGLQVVLIIVVVVLLLWMNKKEHYGQGEIYYNQTPDNWAWNAAPGAGLERFDQGITPMSLAKSERIHLMQKIGCQIPPSAANTPDVLGALQYQERKNFVNSCGPRV